MGDGDARSWLYGMTECHGTNGRDERGWRDGMGDGEGRHGMG